MVHEEAVNVEACPSRAVVSSMSNWIDHDVASLIPLIDSDDDFETIEKRPRRALAM